MQSGFAIHRRSRSDIVYDLKKLELSSNITCDVIPSSNIQDSVLPLTSNSLSQKITSHIMHKPSPKITPPTSPLRNIKPLFRTSSHKDFSDTTFSSGELGHYGLIRKSPSVSSLKRLNPMNFIRRKSNPPGYSDFIISPEDSNALDAGIIYGTRTHEWGGVSNTTTFTSQFLLSTKDSGREFTHDLESEKRNDTGYTGSSLQMDELEIVRMDMTSSSLPLSLKDSPKKINRESTSLEILREEHEDSQSDLQIPPIIQDEKFDDVMSMGKENGEYSEGIIHGDNDQDDMRSLFSFEKYNLERNASLSKYEDVELELEKLAIMMKQKNGLQILEDHSDSFFQGYEDEFDQLAADEDNLNYEDDFEDDVEFGEKTGHLFNDKAPIIFSNINNNNILAKDAVPVLASDIPFESSLEPPLLFRDSSYTHLDQLSTLTQSAGKYDFILQGSGDFCDQNFDDNNGCLEDYSHEKWDYIRDEQNLNTYNNGDDLQSENDLLYDGLLDEVNKIPAEFDGDDLALLSRKNSQNDSSSSRSSLRRSHSHLRKPKKGNGVAALAVSPANNLLQLPSANVTVTLFAPNQPISTDSNEGRAEIEETGHEKLVQEPEASNIMDLLRQTEFQTPPDDTVRFSLSNFENRLNSHLEDSNKSDLLNGPLEDLPRPCLPRRGSLTPISEQSVGSDYAMNSPLLAVPHP